MLRDERQTNCILCDAPLKLSEYAAHVGACLKIDAALGDPELREEMHRHAVELRAEVQRAEATRERPFPRSPWDGPR